VVSGPSAVKFTPNSDLDAAINFAPQHGPRNMQGPILESCYRSSDLSFLSIALPKSRTSFFGTPFPNGKDGKLGCWHMHGLIGQLQPSRTRQNVRLSLCYLVSLMQVYIDVLWGANPLNPSLLTVGNIYSAR
jgi:hypothetical protein